MPKNSLPAFHRRHFLQTGLGFTSYNILAGTIFPSSTRAEEAKPAADIIGNDMILRGLNGMSRVTGNRSRLFKDGHAAAAVIASTFFCREQNLNAGTQKDLLTFMERGILRSSLYDDQPKEESNPDLIPKLVEDLDDQITDLKGSGHNIIFITLCVKALRQNPATATPQRIEGIRKMLQCFTENDRNLHIPDDHNYLDLSDEKKFIHWIFEEYLDALELYLNGKGHHGFAGHVLTNAHALIELKRMGFEETANKGMNAFWQFITQTRKGANRGGKRVPDGPPDFPSPLQQEYWEIYQDRSQKKIPSSHLIKYPYSFYALSKELEDDALKKRLLENLFHLSAVS